MQVSARVEVAHTQRPPTDAGRRQTPSRRSHARPAPATLAAIQGGLVLIQTLRDPQQLRIALDAEYAYLRSFAA
jgi:hypothetical protein